MSEEWKFKVGDEICDLKGKITGTVLETHAVSYLVKWSMFSNPVRNDKGFVEDRHRLITPLDKLL